VPIAAVRQSPLSIARSMTGRYDLPRFSRVVRCLVKLRIELTAARRESEPGDRLERCNAILSIVIGGEYPLVAGIRRDRLQRARLADR
jgi:hypothetical protein